MKKEEIGLKKVSSWAFRIAAIAIILLCAIGEFWLKDYLTGFLFLVVLAFVLTPRKIFRITRTLKIVIVIVAIFAVLFVGGAMMPKPQAKTEQYAMGQEFMLSVGNANYSAVVADLSENTTTQIGEEQKTTNGKFLLVHGYLTNPTQQPAYPITMTPYIIDGQNNSYNPIAENYDKETAMQPKIKRDFVYTFELPKEVAGLKLYIRETEYSTKIINLGS